MIECSLCGSNSWCVWHKQHGDWMCQVCFLAENNTIEEWNTINEEAKERRRQKRKLVAESEFNDFSYNPATTTQKPRKCKFNCGTMLIWDVTQESNNKFIELETKTAHSSVRCQALQHALKLKGKEVYKQG